MYSNFWYKWENRRTKTCLKKVVSNLPELNFTPDKVKNVDRG